MKKQGAEPGRPRQAIRCSSPRPSSQKKEETRKRGNEDPPHGNDPTSTGGSASGGVASSTQKRPQTPPKDQDPKDDPADYLFGPDGEEEPEKPENVAALTCPTAVSSTGNTDNENGDLKKNGLVHRICSVDVCEIFSPPRVTTEAIKYGMNVGDAMDLTTGWDFHHC